MLHVAGVSSAELPSINLVKVLAMSNQGYVPLGELDHHQMSLESDLEH